jgi:8-hydroxy-5-deazaflavin:NADPH oxidoreductase
MAAIGFIGGTGPLGRGTALRLAVGGHEVALGSRKAAKAQETVEGLRERLGGAPLDPATNKEAVKEADLVFVTVPYSAQAQTLESLADALAGKIVVSTVNPIEFDERGPKILPVVAGSAAEECQALLPGARVVSALHTVPARALLRVPEPVGSDTVVCGDDDDAKAEVIALLGDIPGLRALDGGTLRLSIGPETMTAVLLAMNRIHGGHGALRIDGLG